MFLTFLKANSPLESVVMNFSRVESFGLSSSTEAKGTVALAVSITTALMVTELGFCAFRVPQRRNNAGSRKRKIDFMSVRVE